MVLHRMMLTDPYITPWAGCAASPMGGEWPQVIANCPSVALSVHHFGDMRFAVSVPS